MNDPGPRDGHVVPDSQLQGPFFVKKPIKASLVGKDQAQRLGRERSERIKSDVGERENVVKGFLFQEFRKP
jgi:hypothetical protein